MTRSIYEKKLKKYFCTIEIFVETFCPCNRVNDELRWISETRTRDLVSRSKIVSYVGRQKADDRMDGRRLGYETWQRGVV